MMVAYEVIIAAIGIALTFMVLEVTVVIYFRKVTKQNAEQIIWKKTVETQLESIILRLHWQDVGFEANFKFFEIIFANLDVDHATRVEVSKEIRELLMKRLQTGNPAYKKGSELERYFREKVKSKPNGRRVFD